MDQYDFAQITEAVLGSYSLSEAQLAKRLDVSQPTIHRIKTGETKEPGYSLGRKLLELFNERPEAA
jgi:predicted transcriptional regulator